LTINSVASEVSPDDLRLATLYVALGKAIEILVETEESTLSGPDILRGLLIESVEMIVDISDELLLEAVSEVKKLVLIEKKEEPC
jgi:hypothetical protein